LAAAIALGLLAIGAAGGMKTAAGLLNFVMILKFVLIAVALKAITLQAADSNLRAPRTTCKVMAVGFLAMYLGSLLYRYTTKLKGVVRDVNDAKTYLALAIVFSVACLGSSAVLLIFQTSYATDLAGGLWGVAHQLQGASSFCVVPAMYYAWSSGSRRFLSHPLVVTILMLELGFGIVSTTKQGTMEPLLCYLGVGAIRYGIKSKALWGLVAAGGVFYVSIVYPYSQYVRDHGGRNGSIRERLQVIQEVFLNVTTNSDFRNMVDSQISNGDFYLNREGLRPVSRLAMIGEADRLIAATDDTQSYTGWETITNGFRLMMPSFLVSDKPTSGGGNFLGHIVGELAPDDMTTQVSYGFMANFYNAFGLYGVLFGTIIFIAIFHYVIRLWFSTPYLEFGPWGSSIWYVLLGMLFEHNLIEGPVGNMLPTFVNLSAVVGLALLSKWLVTLFGPRRAPTGY
jgi:hypothetical protein